MNTKRIIFEKPGIEKTGMVVYWMQRDQRVNDNWTLIHSLNKAKEKNLPYAVIFCLVPKFLDATIRQYGFMLKGLKKVEEKLEERKIPFVLLSGEPSEEIPKFVEDADVSLLISDFNPLYISRKWKSEVTSKIDIPYKTIDTHNIVPVTEVSDKAEFAAYTFRPKINKKLIEFADEFPTDIIYRDNPAKVVKNDWEKIIKNLEIDFKVDEVDWLLPGEEEAEKMMNNFLCKKLTGYKENRNNPNVDAVSNLSPYLHFGHISAQRVYLETLKQNNQNEDVQVFLEELVVRRELSDNFCLYNKDYDNFSGFHEWAQVTLNNHREDKREYLYELNQFEYSETHDKLWNAAQNQMKKSGKMHGYLRMYWAKKILEWTVNPETAIATANYLNDKYELDGRDPNGYTGSAWSIGGVHDRPWFEREVYGKIRYMNFNGAKRKFDVDMFIDNWG